MSRPCSSPSGAQTLLGESEYTARLALLQAARAGDAAAVDALYRRYRVRVGTGSPPVIPARTEATMSETTVACEVCGAEVKARGLGVHKRRKHGIVGLGKDRPCPYCGEAKANPHEHMRTCPQRPGGTGAQAVRTPRKILMRGENARRQRFAAVPFFTLRPGAEREHLEWLKTTGRAPIIVRSRGKLGDDLADLDRAAIAHNREQADQGNGCHACPWRGLERAIDRELVAEAVRGGMGLEAAAAFVRRVRETR